MVARAVWQGPTDTITLRRQRAAPCALELGAMPARPKRKTAVMVYRWSVQKAVCDLAPSARTRAH
eukprot:15451518-Alexandrium_andersonii.AAC.1